MTSMRTERYRDRLAEVGYAGGMTSVLNARGLRIVDSARFAEPLRERIRSGAQRACAEAGIEIEPSNKPPSARRTGWRRCLPAAAILRSWGL